MDEPTNGLDAEGLVMLRDVLIERARAGRFTIFATHDRAFASRVADTEVCLSQGKLTPQPALS